MITVLTPPTSYHLTTIATARREVRLDDAVDTAGLEDLISEASKICAAWCNRHEGFGLQTVQQVDRVTRARDMIVLERDLAPTVTSLTVSDETLVEGTDWEREDHLLYRLSGDYRTWWTAGVVTITYSAGYVLVRDLPSDIERACIIVLAHLWGLRGRDPGVRSENDGLITTSYWDMRDGIPAAAAALLKPYRRIYL